MMAHHIKLVLVVFLLTFFLHILGSAQEVLKCPICGMGTNVESKTGFDSVRNGKVFRACSFSCAHRFHKKSPESPLTVKDYLSGETVDAKNAFYLIKSEKLLKEIEFGMPPTVVAFKDEESAKKTKNRLGDGEIVHGYDWLDKAFK